MRAQSMPRTDPREERMLVVDPQGRVPRDAAIGDLPVFLNAGDVLVVNDAATVPASLECTAPAGLEVRLLARDEDGSWSAVLFGAGDWRTDTDERPAPRHLEAGELLEFGALAASVVTVSDVSPRLVRLRFDRDDVALWRALYAHGKPVQYSYLEREFALARFQTAYAARPWAVEMPSAGRPLRGALLVELARAGVEIVALTHAAGLSATGDPSIDALLPVPEHYEIPPRTVETVGRARDCGARVVAVGTTVVRALEGCVVTHGELRAGADSTDLLVGPGFEPQVVDGLLSGMHAPGESHYRLLAAFAPDSLLLQAHAHAASAGYVAHEFGDSLLVLPGADSVSRPRRDSRAG